MIPTNALTIPNKGSLKEAIILDLPRVVADPYYPMLLANMSATVIKNSNPTLLRKSVMEEKS